MAELYETVVGQRDACPGCGSGSYESSPYGGDSLITCTGCGRKWVEVEQAEQATASCSGKDHLEAATSYASRAMSALGGAVDDLEAAVTQLRLAGAEAPPVAAALTSAREALPSHVRAVTAAWLTLDTIARKAAALRQIEEGRAAL